MMYLTTKGHAEEALKNEREALKKDIEIKNGPLTAHDTHLLCSE